MIRIRLNLQIVSVKSTFTKEPIYDFCLYWFRDRLKKPSNPRANEMASGTGMVFGDSNYGWKFYLSLCVTSAQT